MAYRKIHNYNIITIYNPLLLKGLFRFFVVTILLIVGFYTFFMYQTIDVSYKVGQEIRTMNGLQAVYQEREVEYLRYLEELHGSGENSLGLLAPGQKIFVDRYIGVARLGP